MGISDGCKIIMFQFNVPTRFWKRGLTEIQRSREWEKLKRKISITNVQLLAVPWSSQWRVSLRWITELTQHLLIRLITMRDELPPEKLSITKCKLSWMCLHKKDNFVGLVWWISTHRMMAFTFITFTVIHTPHLNILLNLLWARVTVRKIKIIDITTHPYQFCSKSCSCVGRELNFIFSLLEKMIQFQIAGFYSMVFIWLWLQKITDIF